MQIDGKQKGKLFCCFAKIELKTVVKRLVTGMYRFKLHYWEFVFEGI